MKPRFFVFLIFLILNQFLYSQEYPGDKPVSAPSIAVWPAKGINVDRYVPLVVTRLIEEFLKDTGEFVIIDQPSQQKKAEEKGVEYSSLSFDQALEYGGSAGIDYLVRSEITKSSSGFTVDFAVFDLHTRTIVHDKKATAQTFDLLDLPIENAIVEITRNIVPGASLVETRAEEALRVKKEKINASIQKDSSRGSSIPLPLVLRSGAEFTQSLTRGIANYYLMYRAPIAYTRELRENTNYNDGVTGVDLFTDSADELFPDYKLNAGAGYAFTTLSAAAGISADLYLPNELSNKGRFCYGIGLFFDIFSFGAFHVSSILLLDSEEQYNRYISYTGFGPQEFYSDYLRSRENADTLAALGLGSAIAAGLLKSISPIIPGEKLYGNRTGTQKGLQIAGDSCMALGSIAGGLSFIAMQHREEVYLEYTTASSNIGELSSELNRLENLYSLSAISAYALYGLGAVLKTAALWLPQNDSTALNNQPEKVNISVVAIPSGGMITLHY